MITIRKFGSENLPAPALAPTLKPEVAYVIVSMMRSVIDEGSWGSSGGVLSILPLLESGVFTEERVKAVRAALGA